jgi:acetolactate synthase-1/2/3 large subunit
MAQLTGAQILIQTLIDQGVDTVFGYPGGAVLDIYDALYAASDRIHAIETTHEQHACHAADGYARATGRCGVVIATSGPGATNLVTGIATAYLDSVPLVAITGNVSNAAIGSDSFQEVDITGITLPVTKHNYFVNDVSRLQDVIREAFAIAMDGRRGPVLVDIPKDVQVNACDYEPKGPMAMRPRRAVAQEDLERAADAINGSRRPYIYVGGGVVASGAGELVCELAERISSPIGCSLMGISAIPSDNPCFLGMEGMHGRYTSTMAMKHSDCVIALGARFNDRSTGDSSKFPANNKIVRIDIDSSEVSKTVFGQVDLVGDVTETLGRLLPLIGPNTHEEWRRQVREIAAKEKGFADYRTTLTPKTVMDAINAHRTPGMPVATDVGQHQMWAAQYLRFAQPRTFITSGGLGTMGFGMGAAIGAQVGTGERAILVTGDGSFGMNLSEMITLADEGLPVTIVLMNNGVLGMVRQWQSLFYGQRYAQTTLDRKVDYVALAKACGVPACRVEDVPAFDKALAESFANDGPALIECPIGKDEFVTPMMPAGGTMDDIIVNEDEALARIGR